MPTLTNKQVLVVGDENASIREIEEVMRHHNMTIKTAHCEEVTPEYITGEKVDLILVNHMHEGETCQDMLINLRTANITATTPIFIMVKDLESTIQHAISHGAADYITPQEDPSSIIEKMKAVFVEDDEYLASAIDISPIKATITATGIRVFLVEDDPLLRNLLSLRLDRSSFPYKFSTGGDDVIASMKQFKPDIIILDLMLPGRSGFDVLREVKSDDLLQSVPVIVFSNRDSQEDKVRAKELGADDFFVKAMTDLSELIETIETKVKG